MDIPGFMPSTISGVTSTTNAILLDDFVGPLALSLGEEEVSLPVFLASAIVRVVSVGLPLQRTAVRPDGTVIVASTTQVRDMGMLTPLTLAVCVMSTSLSSACKLICILSSRRIVGQRLICVPNRSDVLG